MTEKFISFLKSIPDDVLFSLGYILANQEATHTLRDVVKGTLDLRKAEKALQNVSFGNSSKPPQTEPKLNKLTKNRFDIAIEASKAPIPISANIRNKLFIALFDKSKYPTTKDVIDEVNSSFNAHFSYSSFRKRGRRDLVQNLWAYLSSLPENERINRMKRFFAKNPLPLNDRDQYAELFRILANAK